MTDSTKAMTAPTRKPSELPALLRGRIHTICVEVFTHKRSPKYMSIPANPENDEDLVVCGAIREAATEIDRLQSSNAELLAALQAAIYYVPDSAPDTILVNARAAIEAAEEGE